MSHNEKHSGSRETHCLAFSCIKYHCIFNRPLTQPVQICKFSIFLLLIIFLYIIHSSAKSLIVDSIFLQKSFTYARNRSGPNTLPWGTPDVTLTSSTNCPFNRLGPQRCWSPLHITVPSHLLVLRVCRLLLCSPYPLLPLLLLWRLFARKLIIQAHNL
jgi:hypothetical protein